jgi:predicted RNA methylase
MATDIAKVIANLASFYDFSNKSVVHVGAGGGQFIGYASDARHVVAVDPDAAALEPLRAAIGRLGLGDRFTVRQSRFESLSIEMIYRVALLGRPGESDRRVTR